MQVVMPLDLGRRIEANDRVRTLIEVTERMDYTQLTKTYEREPRAGEASPKQMFQIVILGFMTHHYSTRSIAEACRNDIRFIWLLGPKRAPEHSKIARFIKAHLVDEVAENLFYQLVLQLYKMGEIEFLNLFVDGTKEEANANRYSFVWQKSTNKHEERCLSKLAALLERLTIEYGIVSETAEHYQAVLKEMMVTQRVGFVEGRGKRKSKLQKDFEELSSLLEKKEKYAQYQQTFKGRNSFSKTDTDATFMRMKDDHMQNGQLKPGYNLLLGTEGEYIVGVHISSERADELALRGLLERMDVGLLMRFLNLIGDAGFESEENYTLLEERGQIAYIKPQNYERSKTRKYRNNAYLRENMPYDENTDTYICPAGKIFERVEESKRKSKSGFERNVTIYECFGCEGCTQKALCTKAKGNRRMEVSKDFLALRDAARERITSEHGQRLRLNRSIQAEGVFGVLKQDYGFRRFLRRGEANVFTESLLYAMAYNLNKLHSKRMRNLSGCTLHQLSSA